MKNTFGVQLCNNATSNTYPRSCRTVYRHESRLFDRTIKMNEKQYNEKCYYALVSGLYTSYSIQYTDAFCWKTFIFIEPQKKKREYASNRVMHAKYSNEWE